MLGDKYIFGRLTDELVFTVHRLIEGTKTYEWVTAFELKDIQQMKERFKDEPEIIKFADKVHAKFGREQRLAERQIRIEADGVYITEKFK